MHSACVLKHVFYLEPHCSIFRSSIKSVGTEAWFITANIKIIIFYVHVSPAQKQLALSPKLGICSNTLDANQTLCQDICRTTANGTRSDAALEPTEEDYFLESLASWGAGLEPWTQPAPSQSPACPRISTRQPSITHTGETKKEKSWRRMKNKRIKD